MSLQASYVTANSIRDNNSFYAAGSLAVVVNAANPTSGYCYGPSGGAPINCHGNEIGLSTVQTGSAPALPASCPNPGASTSQCAYLVAENGLHATFNQVVPKFFSSSLTDEFRPSDKWLFNLGVRLDSFTFDGSDTSTAPYSTSPAARTMWTNAFNLDNCVNDISGVPSPKTGSVTAACPAGTTPAFFQNVPSQTYTYNIWQPRISGTYTVNSDSVVRFSYGRYVQAPNTAYEQYNVSQEDLADYIAANFYAFGRTTPGYPVAPATSINYDISWEQHLKGTDISYKLTPFLRQTQGQIQNFYLDQKTGFVSGLNAGSQRSQGVEFQMTKGDFSKNGFAGQLSFAYTDSYIKYGSLASGANGTTVITGTNQAISDYNALTKACAPGGAYFGKMGFNHVPLCGTAVNGAGATVAAAPCYTTAGARSRRVVRPPTSVTRIGIILKRKSIQIASSRRSRSSQAASDRRRRPSAYRTPRRSSSTTNTTSLPSPRRCNSKAAENTVIRRSCRASIRQPVRPCLPGVAGSNGGGRYDATKCGVGGTFLAAIPDTYTGVFDGIGAFTQPNLIALNLQLNYDVSPRISLKGTLTNIVNTCWGGSVEPWNITDHNVCSYAANGYEQGYAGEIQPVGNMYNPAGFNGSIVQPFAKYPYGRSSDQRARTRRMARSKCRSSSTSRQKSNSRPATDRVPGSVSTESGTIRRNTSRRENGGTDRAFKIASSARADPCRHGAAICGASGHQRRIAGNGSNRSIPYAGSSSRNRIGADRRGAVDRCERRCARAYVQRLRDGGERNERLRVRRRTFLGGAIQRYRVLESKRARPRLLQSTCSPHRDPAADSRDAMGPGGAY